MPNLDIERVLTELENMKADAIFHCQVSHLTSLYDHMIICSATSTRHMQSIADKLTQLGKTTYGTRPKDNGPADTGWLLVDLDNIIIHIMLPETRTFYQLERLWNMPTTQTTPTKT
jgi:ribosome-associated protein